eukprot:COSAG06_NODE_34980_length_466_cov_1.128065_1_plen_81_part_01
MGLGASKVTLEPQPQQTHRSAHVPHGWWAARPYRGTLRIHSFTFEPCAPRDSSPLRKPSKRRAYLAFKVAGGSVLLKARIS